MNFMKRYNKSSRKSFKNFQIGSDTYTVLDELGSGGYSTIHKCKRGKDIFAVKRMCSGSDENIARFEREIDIMRKLSALNCENILKMITYLKKKADGNIMEYYIVMPLCVETFTESLKLLKKHPSFEKLMLRVFKQIANALSYLHSYTPPISHRDIKEENILRVGPNEFVLCDFGSCTDVVLDPKKIPYEELNNEVTSNTTVSYRAPEMINTLYGHLIGPKVDIWAMGCFLYKASFGVMPFLENLCKISDGDYKFPSNTNLLDIQSLIKKLLVVNPLERPDIELVIQILNELLQETSPSQLKDCQSVPTLKVQEDQKISQMDYLPSLEEHPRSRTANSFSTSKLSFENVLSGKNLEESTEKNSRHKFPSIKKDKNKGHRRGKSLLDHITPLVNKSRTVPPEKNHIMYDPSHVEPFKNAKKYASDSYRDLSGSNDEKERLL